MLDRKIAATATTLTPRPPSIDRPMTIDSGIPSSTAPTAIAVPLAPFSLAGGWHPERLRWRAPRCDSHQLASVYTAAPPRKPSAVEANPPVWKACSISSKESAEIRTPLPKAMTAAIRRCGTASR